MANFNFSFQPGIASEQIIGFEMAGRLWSQYLQDDAIFDIHVAKTDNLPPGVIGGAVPGYVATDMATVQRALSQDATSTDDAIAIANLNTESDPNGFTQYRALLGDTPYQSSNLSLTHANAKALGLESLVAPNSADGYVLFNSLNNNSFTWDYDFSRTSASSSRQIDFLSMAVHELGHIMGFISGVDVIGDLTNQANLGQTSLLDLFRYSDRSTEQNARELTAGQAAYFSIDGGQTQRAAVASGLISVPGGVEGYQASHWAYQAPDNSSLTPEIPEFDLNTAVLDLINIAAPVTPRDAELTELLYLSELLYNNEIDIGAQTNTTLLENARQATYKSLGVMDPALVPGFRSNISSLDLQALDVIGYNLTDVSLAPDYAAVLQETQAALAQEVGSAISNLDDSLRTSSLIQDRQSALLEAIGNNQSLFERRRSRVRTRRWTFWQEDGLDPSAVNIVSDGAGDIAQVAVGEGRTQVTTVQAIPYAQLFYRSDTLIGSDANDYIYPVLPDEEVLSIDAGSGNNIIILGAFEADVTTAEGDDTIIGVDSRESVQNVEKGYTVNAGEGNNYLYLTSERAAVNVVTGNGDDYISVSADNNVVDTSGGNNQIYSYGLFGLGIGGLRSLTENAGIPDLRLSTPNANRISTGDGNDSIFLLAKDATVTTTGGDNIIHIQGPQNSRVDLSTGAGNDEVILASDAGVIDVGDGNNVVTITSSLDRLGLSADSLDDFSVTTGDGNDVVRLSVAQANVFTGGGNDIIELAGGQQSITTGSGNDLIVLGDRQGSYTRFGTQAIITDFAEQDTLLLHGAQQDYQLTSDNLLYQGQRLANFTNGVNFSLESSQVVFTDTNLGSALAEQVGVGPDSFQEPLSPLDLDNENRPFEERYNGFREERPFSYAITGGDDADLFGINPITGDVQFKVAPNVRTPLDADGDNIYDVIVQASLGSGQSSRDIDAQQLAIVVSSNSNETSTSNEASTEEGRSNLLLNGSFEANAVANDSRAKIETSDMVGWQSWQGQKFELWDSGREGVESTDGSNHLELDLSRSLDGIYQDIQTESGQTYQLTFDMRARDRNITSDDEAVFVEWNGQKTNVDGYHAAAVGKWTTIAVEVEGTGSLDRLLLRESTARGASDRTGPFLDNIELRPLVGNAPQARSIDTAEIRVAVDNTIRGTTGNDRLMGTLANDQLLGLGGKDHLAGGAGADQFILGDANGSFYTQAGWRDRAHIKDFDVGIDQLVLQGSAADYTIKSEEKGLRIYAGNDYIAYLKGVTEFDLNTAKYVS